MPTSTVGSFTLALRDRDEDGCQPEDTLSDDPDARPRRKQRREVPGTERIELRFTGPPSVPRRAQHAVTKRAWEPVHEGQERMRIDREPAVRGCDEGPSARSDELVGESPLLLAAADVLDDGV